MTFYNFFIRWEIITVLFCKKKKKEKNDIVWFAYIKLWKTCYNLLPGKYIYFNYSVCVLTLPAWGNLRIYNNYGKT